MPPRAIPGFNKKELELLLVDQMAQLEAMKALLVDLKLVSEQEFSFLVKKANERVMERLAREGMVKTVRVFQGPSTAPDLLDDDD
jgi:hypothetical protein